MNMNELKLRELLNSQVPKAENSQVLRLRLLAENRARATQVLINMLKNCEAAEVTAVTNVQRNSY